jgi:hypothetical protein
MVQRARFRRRLFGAVAALACVAVTLPRFVLDSADSIQRMTPLQAAGVAAWWVAPLMWFLWVARSTIVLVTGAALYVAAAALLLPSMYANDSSTAGLGIVFGPAYLAFAAAVVLAAERLVLLLAERLSR